MTAVAKGPTTFENGYEAGYHDALKVALSVLDRMRGPGTASFSTSMLLAIRTQLLDAYSPRTTAPRSAAWLSTRERRRWRGLSDPDRFAASATVLGAAILAIGIAFPAARPFGTIVLIGAGCSWLGARIGIF